MTALTFLEGIGHADHCQISVTHRPRKQRTVIPIAERLWPKIDKRGPDECWPWTGAKRSNGYGNIGRGRAGAGNVGPHVVVWELMNGPIPASHEIDHTCHKPTECAGGFTCPHRLCCNPAHLAAVLPTVNTSRERRVSAAALRTHCPRGHPYSGDNLIQTARGRWCRACKKASRR